MAASQLAAVKFRLPSARLSGTPVLLYHGLTVSSAAQTPDRDGKYWVPADHFRSQLSLINEAGYRAALLRELWSPPKAVKQAKPAAVLTFDDGRASDYQIAFPLLQGAGLRAEFFLNTASIGTPGFLSWKEIAEMLRAGMSFQSHSHDHVDLSRLPPRELERQLGNSKRLLEDRLGSAVDFLAVPYGLLSKQVLRVAGQVGYRAVCSSWNWRSRPGTGVVHRVAVYRDTTLRQFRGLLVGDPLYYLARAARAALAYLPKRILLHYRPSQLGVRTLEEQA